jgi:hypothetical protein
MALQNTQKWWGRDRGTPFNSGGISYTYRVEALNTATFNRKAYYSRYPAVRTYEEHYGVLLAVTQTGSLGSFSTSVGLRALLPVRSAAASALGCCQCARLLPVRSAAASVLGASGTALPVAAAGWSLRWLSLARLRALCCCIAIALLSSARRLSPSPPIHAHPRPRTPQAVLLTLTTAMTLMAVATTLVQLVARFAMPQREMYVT